MVPSTSGELIVTIQRIGLEVLERSKVLWKLWRGYFSNVYRGGNVSDFIP